MIKKRTKNEIGTFGLIISSVGTIISVIAIAGSNGAYQISQRTGIKYHMAIVSNLGFEVGLFLIIFGFWLQLSERIYKKEYIDLCQILRIIMGTAICWVIINFISYIFFY